MPGEEKTFESEVKAFVVSTVSLFISNDEESTRNTINTFIEAMLDDKKLTENEKQVMHTAADFINSLSFHELQHIEETVKKKEIPLEENKEEKKPEKPASENGENLEELINDIFNKEEEQDDNEEEEDDDEAEGETFLDRMSNAKQGTKFVLVDDRDHEENYYILGVYRFYNGPTILMSKDKKPTIDNSICFRYEADIDALSLIEGEEEIAKIKERVSRRFSSK